MIQRPFLLIYNQTLSIAKTRTIVGVLLQPATVVNGNRNQGPLTRVRRFNLSPSAARFMFSGCAVLCVLGCGSSYRPVVTAINPVGPAGQPQKYAVAISQPTSTGNGLLTFVDFAGDSVLINATLGVSPYYLALDAGGGTGYTLNGDGTVNSFSITTTLLSNEILQTTLVPSRPLPNSIFPQGTNLYVTEPGRNSVAQLQSSPPELRQELPVGPNVVYIAGVPNAPRIYAISQNTGGNGQVTPIETTSNTTDSPIPVGVQPVYGVMTADGRRAFILNRGSGTVSVINAQTNLLDRPALLPTGTIVTGAGPVWADFAPTRTELAVLNSGSGAVTGSRGSLSLINIPLCSSVALPTNPNCDPNNPVDATGFGQVLASVPVGVSPVVVSVLQDGTRAYVANFGDTVTCPTTLPAASAIPPRRGCGTVSVVNLQTNTVTATIPVAGHPTFLVATTGMPTGKIYVTSTETSLMTVLRTDIDVVLTYVDLQGAGGQVRVTLP